jgi:hypothetical protein
VDVHGHLVTTQDRKQNNCSRGGISPFDFVCGINMNHETFYFVNKSLLPSNISINATDVANSMRPLEEHTTFWNVTLCNPAEVHPCSRGMYHPIFRIEE